ncbi:putative CheW protein [Roseivivax marinus]|uniref:Putative CheW protein n=1 Tax=Roseivivax marinus TaxID=1379903 RepID=W4HMP8_9RHOB|nr:chemotaxis protein CheW [Roseivivax marinus]ETW13270.1 putative CheW protein [Roseivivax marinus]UMA66564.1 chemotaxis protein CheW [Roseivivax marinus]SEK72304.1 purine-binding chemotaxis protein CheW [Roseivivax marinus]
MSEHADPNGTSSRELVSFAIGDQDFCMDIMLVREIRGWTNVTMLPHAPSYILGVINLRGAVVPIVDLASRLGLPPLEPTSRHVIIIAVLGDQTVGFLVSAVSDILGAQPSEIQPPPRIASDPTAGFIEGVIASDERMLRILNLASVLPRIQMPETA